ncbi:MAG: chromate efflux transporter, partial [Proteobacteria bacterium]
MLSQFVGVRNSNPVSLREAFKVWVKISLLSFGGPAGQIAVMHKTIVEEKNWVSEARFLHALNYCMLLPGPEAQQLAIYIGWLMHRWIGGLIAGILFVLPGFFSILILSVVYALYQNVSFVEALFFGLKPVVISIVVAAVIRIGSKTLKTPVMVSLAVLSFIALFFFSLPFPVVIAVAALIGFVGGKISPQNFEVGNSHATKAGVPISDDDIVSRFETRAAPSHLRSLAVLVIFGTLWWAPIAFIYFFYGRNNVFTQEALFFSKASFVTFGGAYAVLAYIAQQAVETYGWLKPHEMVDGLGMAETTPGPLIQVVQFVGFMGAFRVAQAGGLGLSPVIAGVLASGLTTWVTFVPCFLWIFLGAPYIESLRNNKDLSRA